MIKKIFSFTLLGILCTILIVNIIQNVRDNNEKDALHIQTSSLDSSSIDIYNEGLTEGDIPPDFKLQTPEGKEIRLSDYNGQKVLLNFWATWCPPCKAEMPHMENFYKRHAEEYDIELIAVNLTNEEKGSNPISKVENFINDYELTFPVPLDQDGEVSSQYGIIAIPTSYFIHSNGFIHKKVIGPMDEDIIKTVIEEMK